jgi:putative glutamine amidotransferase
VGAADDARDRAVARDGATGRPPPVIGVTVPYRDPGDAATAELVRRLWHGIWQAVLDAGGRPVALSVADAPAAAPPYDGLVLTGGGDIDPRAYGDSAPHPSSYAVSARHDAFELALVADALEAGRPVLGVCRGMQLLNVAQGGTLVQHLADPIGAHRGRPGSALMVEHDVEIEDGSRLAQLLGRHLRVPSGHHQAVETVGGRLRVTATGPDGVVEAIEHADRWALGIQWHPEDDLGDPADRQRLFAGYVAAVRDQRANRCRQRCRQARS